MIWRASELAGAEKASYANCAVVSQRTLAATVAWCWQCMAELEWKKGQGLQWRNDYVAFICFYIFTWLAVSVLLVLD